MKSEEELNAELERLNAGDEERQAKLALLAGQGLIGRREEVALKIVADRIRNVHEADPFGLGVGGGWLEQRARRNTKNNLIDALRKLDKQLDSVLTKHGLQADATALAATMRQSEERRATLEQRVAEASGLPTYSITSADKARNLLPEGWDYCVVLRSSSVTPRAFRSRDEAEEVAERLRTSGFVAEPIQRNGWRVAVTDPEEVFQLD